MTNSRSFSGKNREEHMNRRSLLGISVITALGLGLVPSTAIAQQNSLKEQLVGTWTLVSNEVTPPNGTKGQPYGANPKGILIFQAGGRYVQVDGAANRPKFKAAGQPTAEELAAATLGHFAANFGTWSVNEGDKTLTRHYELALRPNNEGTDFKHSVNLVGDELKLSGVVPSTGIKVDSVYRRAK
jgi:Lipocalin-like domain